MSSPTLPDESVFRGEADRTFSRLANQGEVTPEQIVSWAPAILYVYDATRAQSLFQNRPVADLLGFTPEQRQELQDSEWIVLMHPEDQARFPAYRDRMSRMAVGEELTFEFRLRDASDQWRWMLSRDIRIPSGDDRSLIVGSAFDITERKEAENSLRESEERLRLALNTGRMGTFDWDLTTNRVQWSPELEALHGYEPGGFPGSLEAYQAEIYPEDFDAVLASAQNAIATGAKHHAVYRIVKPDGSLKWVEGQGRVISDESGRPVRFVGICSDVHERKQAEEMLARRALEQGALYQFTDRLHRATTLEEVSEAALDAILSALEAPRASILLFDDQGVMRFVAARGLSEGYKAAVEGHSPWKIDEADARAICVESIAGADLPDDLRGIILNEGIHAMSFIPLTSQGGLIGKFMVYYDAVHPFGPGEVDLSLAIARQLAFAVGRLQAEARRRKAEEDLRNLTLELEEKVRVRTADLEGFAYSIAHDMRQHIRGVSMNAYLLMEEAGPSLSKEAQDNVERLVHAARHMSKLTDDILTHTRLGVKDLSKDHVDLTELAAKVAPEIVGRPHRNPKAQVKIQPGLRAVLDPAMASLVLENLLDNACKFSAGVKEPVVEFGRDAHGFFVRDNGIGFNPRYAEQIFVAFERLEPSYEGTGIGLASVKRIIERHGGRVWADSEPGNGATIRFTLPESR